MPRHGYSFLLLSDRHALTALSVTFGRPPLAILRPFRSAELNTDLSKRADAQALDSGPPPLDDGSARDGSPYEC